MAKKFPPLVPGTTAVAQHYRSSITQEALSERADRSYWLGHLSRGYRGTKKRAETDLGGTLPAPPKAPSFSDYLRGESEKIANDRYKVTLNEDSDGVPFKSSLQETNELLVEDRVNRFSTEGPGAYNLFTQAKHALTITHIATGFEVAFPAFLDTFNDAYNTDWTQESVLGRMDPIATFNGTERTLSLGWHVPAYSYANAEANLGAVNQLISYLYPLYDGERTNAATAINQSPLVRISFGNLVVSSVSGDGLLGYCRGVTYDPAMESGIFNETTATGPQYFAKTFRLNLELKVLHDHKLGYRVSDSSKDKITEKFDWSEGLTRRRNQRTITTSYSFNDTDVQWNNFPYRTRVDAGNSNRSTSRVNIINSVERPVETDPTVFDDMFTRQRLGNVNVLNAFRAGKISADEANMLVRGENIEVGETTPDGLTLMDYSQTGMSPAGWPIPVDDANRFPFYP